MNELLQILGYESLDDFIRADKSKNKLYQNGYVLFTSDGKIFAFSSEEDMLEKIEDPFFDEYNYENSVMHKYDNFYLNEKNEVFILSKTEFKFLEKHYLTIILDWYECLSTNPIELLLE